MTSTLSQIFFSCKYLLPVTTYWYQVSWKSITWFSRYCKQVELYEMQWVLWPLTIDLILMTPKYKELIVFSKCIQLSLMSIRRTVLKILWWKFFFAYIIRLCELWPWTTWCPNLFNSLPSPGAYRYQVWCRSVKWFLRYRVNETQMNGMDGRTTWKQNASGHFVAEA